MKFKVCDSHSKILMFLTIFKFRPPHWKPIWIFEMPVLLWSNSSKNQKTRKIPKPENCYKYISTSIISAISEMNAPTLTTPQRVTSNGFEPRYTLKREQGRSAWLTTRRNQPQKHDLPQHNLSSSNVIKLRWQWTGNTGHLYSDPVSMKFSLLKSRNNLSSGDSYDKRRSLFHGVS